MCTTVGSKRCLKRRCAEIHHRREHFSKVRKTRASDADQVVLGLANSVRNVRNRRNDSTVSDGSNHNEQGVKHTGHVWLLHTVT